MSELLRGSGANVVNGSTITNGSGDGSNRREQAGVAPLLICGQHPQAAVSVLSGLTLDLLRRPQSPEWPLRINVVDRADRSLIRLRQLSVTARYVTVDDLDGLQQSLAGLAAPSPGLDVVIIGDLGRLLDFLARSGRSDLAVEVIGLLGRHDGHHLMIAAASTDPEALPATVRACFGSLLRCDDLDRGELAGPDGDRVIDLRPWSPERLTAAIAATVTTSLDY